MAIPQMFGGNFLKIDEVNNGDAIRIVDEGKSTTSPTFKYPELTQQGKPHSKAGQPKDEYHLPVELVDGSVKTLRLNNTSYRQLASAWGLDVANWVGKFAIVEKLRMPTGKYMISLTAKGDNA
jgi:hypothetical protein